MRKPRSVRIEIALIALLTAAASADDCRYAWTNEFQPSGPGVDNTIFASAVHDFGDGPRLVIGGRFNFSGDGRVDRVAIWDGERLRPLGAGFNESVSSLCVWDDGNGPALYAGGGFTKSGDTVVRRIARWDGEAWREVGGGVNGFVSELLPCVLDGISVLCVGGHFTTAGDTEVGNVCAWNGSGWDAMNAGVFGTVSALCTHNNRDGDALYVGGSLRRHEDSDNTNVVRYRAGKWETVVSTDSSVYSLLSVGTGSTSLLYIGGRFSRINEKSIPYLASWDGHDVTRLGDSLDWDVSTLRVVKRGGKAIVRVGGPFSKAGSIVLNGVAEWDGSKWAALGGGLPGGSVETFTDAVDGEESILFAGGTIESTDIERIGNAAVWRSGEWKPLATLEMSGNGLGNSARAMALFPSAENPRLYVGGDFRYAGNSRTNGIAYWDGAAWATIGAGVDGETHSILPFEQDGAVRVVAAGLFTSAGDVTANNIALWDGEAWTALGAGLDPYVYVVTRFRDELYAAGSFSGNSKRRLQAIARWDGDDWRPMPAELKGRGPFYYVAVYATAIWNDGAGESLYFAGDFLSAGDLKTGPIARWDGSTWHKLGGELSGRIFSLDVARGRPDWPLLVGGSALRVDGVSYGALAEWTGTTWRRIDNDDTDIVLSSANEVASIVTDSQRTIFVRGIFRDSNGSSISHLAKWGGDQWIILPDQPNGTVFGLRIDDTRSPWSLFAVGSFRKMGRLFSNQIAHYACAGRYGDLNCDQSVDFEDIDPFVTAIISTDDYAAEYPNCAWLNGDINQDQSVDFNDIDGFVECLINGGCE